MSTSRNTTNVPTIDGLAAGSWRLDPTASTVTFTTRAILGLMKVRGSFSRVDGTVDVADDGVSSGTLRFGVETIDTGNAKRDAHLNRSDFFHTEEYPEAIFTLTAVVPADGGGQAARGTLLIRDVTIPVQAPVTVSTSGGRLRADVTLEIDHGAAGLPFRKPLLISGRARVSANLVFSAG